MTDIKCKNCNKLLMKANVAVVAIRCPRCKMLFEYKVYTTLHVNEEFEPKKKDLKTLEDFTTI